MAKQELLKEVQHNTNKLDDLHEFTNHSRHLEDDLNIRQKTMVRNYLCITMKFLHIRAQIFLVLMFLIQRRRHDCWTLLRYRVEK